jgi:hypothetical protein
MKRVIRPAEIVLRNIFNFKNNFAEKNICRLLSVKEAVFLF